MVAESREIQIKKGMENPVRCMLIDNHQVIPLYDVPHLLKGIRNNLLAKNLIWNNKQEQLKAKWDDILKAYLIDSSFEDVRCLPRITEHHVEPKKIRKMKVSYAAQVLSHSMAGAITLMARDSKFINSRFISIQN